MKRLYRKLTHGIGRISPEVADHFHQLIGEVYVVWVHVWSARRCRKNYRAARNLRLNIGCGRTLKSGFLNLDFLPTADVRLDLRRNIPLPDASCVMVFSEHFLEHLSYPEGAAGFFSECFRLLQPGGMILLSVPDTRWPLLEYANGEDAYLEACAAQGWHPAGCTTFMEHINYHFRQRWSGDSYSHFENHRFAWDWETMQKKLSEAGFQCVTKRDYDPTLDSAHRRVGSLFVSAVKPAITA